MIRGLGGSLSPGAIALGVAGASPEGFALVYAFLDGALLHGSTALGASRGG